MGSREGGGGAIRLLVTTYLLLFMQKQHVDDLPPGLCENVNSLPIIILQVVYLPLELYLMYERRVIRSR